MNLQIKSLLFALGNPEISTRISGTINSPKKACCLRVISETSNTIGVRPYVTLIVPI